MTRYATFEKQSATGNNARRSRRGSGLLAAGKAADIVLIDAPHGGAQPDALSAIRHGDIAAVGALISAGCAGDDAGDPGGVVRVGTGFFREQKEVL
jgi:hypothetical protein